MRTKETISRKDFIRLTQNMECGAGLLEELNSWEGGEDCNEVEYSVDSLGRIDSDSSPSPAEMWYVIVKTETPYPLGHEMYCSFGSYFETEIDKATLLKEAALKMIANLSESESLICAGPLTSDIIFK